MYSCIYYVGHVYPATSCVCLEVDKTPTMQIGSYFYAHVFISAGTIVHRFHITSGSHHSYI